MKANELRIGNWVLFVKKITQVESWMFIQDVKHMAPIPLTPEILEKCGFVFESGIEYINRESGITVYLIKDTFELANHDFPIQLKYLHQLQNLYFALTSEELEIAF